MSLNLRKLFSDASESQIDVFFYRQMKIEDEDPHFPKNTITRSENYSISKNKLGGSLFSDVSQLFDFLIPTDGEYFNLWDFLMQTELLPAHLVNQVHIQAQLRRLSDQGIRLLDHYLHKQVSLT